MVKAHITTPSGISIEVEGTAAEIRAVVEDLERGRSKAKRARTAGRESKPVSRLTLGGILQSLSDEGFFKEPKDLGAIKAELDAKGHFWPITTLSGAVLAQVRKRNFRRLRQDGRWAYMRVG